MDAAERRIAVLDVVDQDPHGADVVEAVDAGLLAPHLEPDAVDVLRPAGDLRRTPAALSSRARMAITSSM
jgi:hypothetical protein